ncbi:Secreted RxLR effector peptide protein [Phytophthora palmivora]|uniref:Secreted RxLR effector peptide protein n=1 Tax=Phytophthora palmivora TaxID=4796 RepID=A0A2P4YK82_9STRA|nr:Secreted RxLR effector peptide protein [Phytophthora palmivora]
MSIGNPKTQFIETKDVIKLFSSTNFKLWSKHVAKVNKENPDAAMLTALTNVFGEKEVAIMILLSKDSWKVGSVVKKLEKAQFNKWFNARKRPDNVLENVLGVKFVNINRNPREKQIWAAYETYSTKRIKNY